MGCVKTRGIDVSVAFAVADGAFVAVEIFVAVDGTIVGTGLQVGVARGTATNGLQPVNIIPAMKAKNKRKA